MQHMSKRYRQGRRIMLLGVMMFAAVHICGYLPSSTPSNLPVNWTRITTFIPAWVWITAWGATFAIGLWELIAQHGRNAVSLTVAITTATGAAYACSYIMTVASNGWGSREWFYFGLYASAALIISGLLTKVGALKQKGPTENV